MKKTIKNVYIKQPHNYWINRRVYVDENDNEYVKINYNFVKLEQLRSHEWSINYSY